jgi:hypothetical protein
VRHDAIYHGTRHLALVLRSGKLLPANIEKTGVFLTRSPEIAAYWANMMGREMDQFCGGILILNRASLVRNCRLEPSRYAEGWKYDERDESIWNRPMNILWTGRALQVESSDGHAVRINLSGLWLELAPPGHHGNPRAALLIRSKASKAMCGARLKLRRETVVPSSSSSREPRRDFNYLLFGSDDCYGALGASAVSYSRAL